jgi:hypothetical protein
VLNQSACKLDKPDPRLIAFYLPQFHPIPENDRWWGRGFTEWTNVVQARPVFRGHDQPHVPADLGFYDLRLPEAREAQASLARAYGVHGFCYYHYWFNGRRVLERPFSEVLSSGRPDLPFCLCWANENWTRAWDGRQRDLLLEQHYSAEDDREHIRALLPALRDPRYILEDGRPLLLIYRARLLPNPRQTTDIWREEAERAGLAGLYLCRVESFHEERDDPGALGFDAAVEFQPDWVILGPPWRQQLLRRVARRIKLARILIDHDPPNLYPYDRLVEHSLAKPTPSYRRFPCVTPMWDNTARRRRGPTMLSGSTPKQYERWLAKTIARESRSGRAPVTVFINAWNEWAEGCHLEPDVRHGRQYLEATRRAIEAQPGDNYAPGSTRPAENG